MTKKVAKDTIKKLIEEVLKEEQLNEFKVSLGGTAATLTNFRGPSKRKISDPTKTKDQIKSLANAADTPNVLDLDDIGKATGQDKTVAQHIADNPGPAVDADKVKARLTGGGAQSKTKERNALSKKLTTDLANLKAQYVANPSGDYTTLETQIQNDLNTLVTLYKSVNPSASTKYGKLNTEFQNYLSSKGNPPAARKILDTMVAGAISNLQAYKTDLTKPSGKLGTPRGVYGDQSVVGQQTQMGAGGTTDLDDAGTKAATVAAARITIPMNELLKAQVMRRETDNDFKVTGTEITTMEGIANEFAKVAAAMNPDNFSELGKLSVDESIMLMTKISFVGSLFGIGKELPQGQEAGYVWEKMSALFMGGFVGGKSGEATDVMSNLFGSSSQKFVAGGISQANKNIENALRAKKKGESLYYLALRKEGGGKAADFNEIYFVLLKLTATNDTTGTFLLKYYNKNGKFFSVHNHANAQVHLKLTAAEVAGLLSKVPVLKPNIPANLNFTEAIGALSDNLSGSGGGDFGELSRTTIAIAKKLSEMQNVTNEYRNAKAAKSAGSFASGNTALDYTNKISDTYLSIKTDYKTLFQKLSDYTGKAATTFQEGKKITASFLKKLISESFKR